jgi:hypothetical protein
VIAVEVRPAVAPDGRTLVLVQLPNGFVLLTPDDARRLAALIVVVADDCDLLQ